MMTIMHRFFIYLLMFLFSYEIQLEISVRRFGLGKQIMKILDEMAKATNLQMVVLTVFKHNPNALAFFRNIG